MQNVLIDSFGRTIDYIRISVTKNCNFRCLYCMPNTPEIIDESVIPLPKMLEFLKIAMDFGVKKIRITGGEPLLRKDLSAFIAGIYSYKSGVEVALTTNAYFLAREAVNLKNAGLKRINISLDSLKADKIARISKKDALNKIMEGIFSAKDAGLKIKLNMVALRGVNDDEIIDMLCFARENGFLLRYIEYISNAFASGAIRGMRSDEILAILRERFALQILKKENFGPAKLYEFSEKSGESFQKNGESAESTAESAANSAYLSESQGDSKQSPKSSVFGIIAPHSDDFCASCNRIRLTAEGVICPCLYFEDAVDISDAIQNGDKEAMIQGLLQSIHNKPEKNKWSENEISTRAFYHTGG